jgi:hypothetical protein
MFQEFWYWAKASAITFKVVVSITRIPAMSNLSTKESENGILELKLRQVSFSAAAERFAPYLYEGLNSL